ncbi:MAG: hypothetical protein MZV64_09355 [Ignavibacteriales bacterium]|nr:hypothetical protein [Ignavibacteriales bacterium]
MHADEPGRIVGARNGSPWWSGSGDGEMLLASDVTAMIAHTKQVVYLNDGEVVVHHARTASRSPTWATRPSTSASTGDLGARGDREGRLLLLHGEGDLRAARVHRAGLVAAGWIRNTPPPSSGGLNLDHAAAARRSSGSRSSPRAPAGTPAWSGAYLLESRGPHPGLGGTGQRDPLPQPGGRAEHPVPRGLPVRRDRGHPLRHAGDPAQGRHACWASATWSARPSPARATAASTSTRARR